MDFAVSRRLSQELGFECPLEYLYKFKYHAQYGAVGAEHEYCWVYTGRYDGVVDVNVNEVADWRFIDIKTLDAELAAEPGRYTPWFKMEWAHLQSHFLDEIVAGANITA
jgi:isopentenyl-diphosphate delta-isomerase